MLKHKAYKFRIYPTQKQKILLNKTFGFVRIVKYETTEICLRR